MLVLVLGSSFLVTFLGWEGVGLCSYLLVSFWFERTSAARGGQEGVHHHPRRRLRLHDRDVPDLRRARHPRTTPAPSARWRARSASTPAPRPRSRCCSSWVRSARARSSRCTSGCPTRWRARPRCRRSSTPRPWSRPVCSSSARAHPFFEASGDAMTVVAWVGAVTALARRHGRARATRHQTRARVLDHQPARLHVPRVRRRRIRRRDLPGASRTRSSRATLFLGAGSVIHGNADNQDMRIMGRFRKYMPYTAFAFVIAWLAIAGVPPFAGFWAKDEHPRARRSTPTSTALWIVGLARRDPHRRLHDPPGLPRLLRQRAVPRHGQRTPVAAEPTPHPSTPTTTARTSSPSTPPRRR